MDMIMADITPHTLKLGLIPESLLAVELDGTGRKLRHIGPVAGLPMPIRIGCHRYYVASEVAVWLEDQKVRRHQQSKGGQFPFCG